MSSESPAQRFARLVIDGLREAGRATDVEVGAAGGPSTTFMTKLRKVAAGEDDMPRPRNDTMRRIEVAAEWPPGVAARVWEGGDVGTTRAVGLHSPLPRDPLMRQWITELLERIAELEERVDLLDPAVGSGAFLHAAARDVGRRGTVRRLRDEQDQAGERPDPEGPEGGA